MEKLKLAPSQNQVRIEFAGLDFRRVLPERGALDLVEVTDDEPVEARKREPLQLCVRRADARVLAEEEEALDLAVEHVERGLVGRVVAADLRQVVEAEVVLLGRAPAPERLQLADQIGVGVAPPAGRDSVVLEVGGEVGVLLRMRHRQVARQDVVKSREVCRSLDRSVSTESDDSASGPADVPEQELDDRGGADVLDADRVLRPADRVDDRARPLASGVLTQRLGDLEELLLRAAADLRDHLRRVAAEVLLQQLEDATRMLERRVFLGRLAVLERS